MSGNPFLSIWMRPRQTVRALVETNPNSYVIMLSGLAGIVRALDRTMQQDLRAPMGTMIVMAVIIGFLGGLFSLWLISHLLKTTGDWIGGKATREHLRTAYAWSAVPSIVMLGVWGLMIGLIGEDLFRGKLPDPELNPEIAAPLMFSLLAVVVLSVWSIVLYANTVAEVQGFRSAWKGLLNIVLSALVVIIPIMMVAVIVRLMA